MKELLQDGFFPNNVHRLQNHNITAHTTTATILLQFRQDAEEEKTPTDNAPTSSTIFRHCRHTSDDQQRLVHTILRRLASLFVGGPQPGCHGEQHLHPSTSRSGTDTLQSLPKICSCYNLHHSTTYHTTSTNDQHTEINNYNSYRHPPVGSCATRFQLQ